MGSPQTQSRVRPPRAVTYNYIPLLTSGRVADLLQVDRSRVDSGVQAGAIVVGVQGELSQASSDAGGGDGTLIGVARAGFADLVLARQSRRCWQ